MRKHLIVVLSFVIVVLPLAIQAEAQYSTEILLDNARWAHTRSSWRSGSIWRGGYGQNYGRNYDPRIIWGPRDGKDDYGREMEPRDLQEYVHDGVRLQGTYHAEKGVLHFRPWDSTHNPFNENHKTCLVVESADYAPEAQQQIVYVERGPTPAPAQDLLEVDGWEKTGSMETKMLLNQFTQAPVRVYNGSEKIAELAPGTSMNKEVPVGAKIWAQAFLVNDKSGRSEWITLQSGRGVFELPFEAGWEFGNPENRPTI